MKFAKLITTVVVCLNIFITNAVKKQIIKEVNICKRYDPQLMKCYCDNINRLIPTAKNGIPEMNVLPIEPAYLEHARLELPETQSVYFQADLNNVTMHGISTGKVENCKGTMTKNGIQLSAQIQIPEIEVNSNYEGHAKILLIAVEAKGDFKATFTGLEVYSKLNSTVYMKNGKEYLKCSAEVKDVKIEKIKIHFNNILGNNKEFNDNINKVINANIDLLYDEVKPIILKPINKIVTGRANDFYGTFPFDVVFPKN